MSIFITVTQLGYTDSEVFGPFESLVEAKEKVTDGLTRGLDGNETRYTFYKMSNLSVGEIGYVLFNDECNYNEDDLREDHF
tara:strand:+ start:376 stop:618 length:243 start_codon:yes stop_codon:yes gene_type:complete